MILTINFTLSYFKHYDWLKILSIQSECLKIGLCKFMLKYLYRFVPCS